MDCGKQHDEPATVSFGQLYGTGSMKFFSYAAALFVRKK